MSKKGGKRITVDIDKLKTINPDNANWMKIFFESKQNLSKQSLIQYENALQIFMIWVLDNCNNNAFTDLKKRDFLRYQNFLLNLGLSSSAIKLKRSAVSSLCNLIENYYQDEYPLFRSIVKGVENVPLTRVYNKEPLTKEEMDILREYLAKNELWQELAYLEVSYSTAGRRAEIRQIYKNVVNNEPNSKGFYTTNMVRCKGKGRQGVVRPLYFSQQAMDAIKKWIDVRGEDSCKYLFVSKYGGKIRQISAGAFNDWCINIFSEAVGRRVHPHLLRSSRATHLVVDKGKDINSAKNLLGHLSSNTTEIYVIRDETESLEDCF